MELYMTDHYSQQEVQSVLFGALLHDIGKFYQRATNDRIKHQRLGGEFVEKYLGREWEIVRYLVEDHHDPENYAQRPYLAKIVQLADWLSSGERYSQPDQEGQVKREPLISIFSKIKFNDSEPELQYFPLRELSTDLNHLKPTVNKPDAISDTSGKKGTKYEDLWSKFVCEMQQVQNIVPENFDKVIEQYLSILEKYTMFIPSAAYKQQADISLYHHLKSTMAIATCILQSVPKDSIDEIHKKYKLYFTSDRHDDTLNQQVAYLIGADIAGIQKFLYSIRARRALKSLKGRSAHVQLLSELTALRIIKEFRLTNANILYCGGGHFYIIVPSVEQTKEILSRIDNEIEQSVHSDVHHLALIYDMVPLNWTDFKLGHFEKKWSELNNGLVIAKRRKHSAYISERGRLRERLGPLDNDLEAIKICSVCGNESDKFKIEEMNDETSITCAQCSGFEERGKEVSNALKLFVAQESSPSVSNYAGFMPYFNRSPKEHLEAYKLNDIDFVSDNCNGFRFLANHVADGSEGLITLEELAEESDCSFKKWGVLRADVDNLGAIFKNGLKDRMSISRLSVLSYLFSLYFSAHIQTIAEISDFYDKTYIVYSGGDDLSIIGSWDILPNLALRIYDDFKKFTGNRSDVTLSAGVFIAPADKYPIGQAAHYAGVELEKAKSLGKDRFTFLNTTVKWDEFKALVKLKNSICDKIGGMKGDNKGRSLLQILYSACEDDDLANDNKISYEHIWRFIYALKRWAERMKIKDVEALEELKNLFVVNHKMKSNTKMAVRWAELLTRKE